MEGTFEEDEFEFHTLNQHEHSYFKALHNLLEATQNNGLLGQLEEPDEDLRAMVEDKLHSTDIKYQQSMDSVMHEFLKNENSSSSA